MANLDDDRTVLELAMLTESRTRSEHAAMKRVARRLTREWNRRTSTNRPERFEHPVDLLADVEASRG